MTFLVLPTFTFTPRIYPSLLLSIQPQSLTSIYISAAHFIQSPHHHQLLLQLLLYPTSYNVVLVGHLNTVNTHFLSQKRLHLITPKSISSKILFSRSKFLPYNKQFAVKTSDTSSSYTKRNGRLFKAFSASNKTVSNSVKDSFSLPMDFFKQLLTIPTNLFQKSPH